MTYVITPPWYKIKPELVEKKKYKVMNGKMEIDFLDDDVLTRNDDGKYTSHVGMCFTNITIPDEDLVEQFEPINLIMV